MPCCRHAQQPKRAGDGTDDRDGKKQDNGNRAMDEQQ
jgi:hypothetical protein